MAPSAAKSPELLTRALSAILLGAGAIGIILLGGWLFAAFVAACALIANWEWSRLTRGEGSDACALIQDAAILGAVAAAGFGLYSAAFLALAAGAALTLFLQRSAGRRLWALAGFAYFGLPALAMIWLRSGDAYGMLAILFVFIVAWATDTFAYIGGRLIGGPKLAPSISPKKTCSGAATGLLFAAVIGFAFAALVFGSPSLYLACVALGLSLACQIGDLAESAAKRRFGAKDASRLIPGHGGLLDRIDGLLIASLLAALIAFRDTTEPGRALLLW